MIDGFLQYTARNHAENTMITRAAHLEVFLRYLRGSTRMSVLPPALLSYRTLADFHEWLGGEGAGRNGITRSDDTRHAMVAVVERFWQWAFKRQRRGDWHGLDYPDSLELRRPVRPVTRAPTWAQVDAMIAESTGWRVPMLVVMRCTGLRVDQVLHLRWDDVDLPGRTLHIRPELGKSAKEKRGRWVPLAPVLVEELATWGRREGWLVPCAREDRSRPHRETKKAWKRAGVPSELWRRRPHHALRKCFSTELKLAGADGEAIDFLLGHVPASTRADVYTDPRALWLVEAVALVPPLGQHLNVRQLAAEEGR